MSQDLDNLIDRIQKMLDHPVKETDGFSDDWQIAFVPPTEKIKAVYYPHITFGEIKQALSRQPLMKPYAAIALGELVEELSTILGPLNNKRELQWSVSNTAGHVFWDIKDNDPFPARVWLNVDGTFWTEITDTMEHHPCCGGIVEHGTVTFASFKEVENFLMGTNGIYARAMEAVYKHTARVLDRVAD